MTWLLQNSIGLEFMRHPILFGDLITFFSVLSEMCRVTKKQLLSLKIKHWLKLSLVFSIYNILSYYQYCMRSGDQQVTCRNGHPIPPTLDPPFLSVYLSPSPSPTSLLLSLCLPQAYCHSFSTSPTPSLSLSVSAAVACLAAQKLWPPLPHSFSTSTVVEVAQPTGSFNALAATACLAPWPLFCFDGLPGSLPSLIPTSKVVAFPPPPTWSFAALEAWWVQWSFVCPCADSVLAFGGKLNPTTYFPPPVFWGPPGLQNNLFSASVALIHRFKCLQMGLHLIFRYRIVPF